MVYNTHIFHQRFKQEREKEEKIEKERKKKEERFGFKSILSLLIYVQLGWNLF